MINFISTLMGILAIFGVMFAGAAILGNIGILIALLLNDVTLITSCKSLTFAGILGDLFVLFYIFWIKRESLLTSLRMVKNGLVVSTKKRKQLAQIEKDVQKFKDDMNRLNRLKALGINKAATIHTERVCKLLDRMSVNETMQKCLDSVHEKKSMLLEINNIQNRITEIAENYCYVGDFDNYSYYMGLIHPEKSRKKQAKMLEKCNVQRILRKKEKKAIARWSISLIIIIILLVQFVGFLKFGESKIIPYYISDQTLTRNMCYDDSFYDYFHSEKGYELLASELTKFHRDNDVNQAMWLLCVQPDCIDGINICASDSFIDWIIDYAKEYGTKRMNANNETVYVVDNYEITLSLYFDYSIGHTFTISDGEGSVTVNKKNEFHEETVPTIE